MSERFQDLVKVNKVTLHFNGVPLSVSKRNGAPMSFDEEALRALATLKVDRVDVDRFSGGRTSIIPSLKIYSR